MLDLDGDGLELRSATSTILFDHDADGVRTGTGWLHSDDGILVRDLNANGTIDSGRELFGVDTLKRNDLNAINGFDALSDLDSNADGSGRDTIRNVEDLAGSDFDDVLTGNAGANRLQGQLGNDRLDGGAGNDTLDGSVGNDTYLFARGSGQDTVFDHDTTAGNTDIVAFGPAIAADQLWFQQNGNHLDVLIIGTGDSVTLANWYSGSAYRVEQFQTSDGQALLESQVQYLVQAMAAFAPPASGQTTLPPSYQPSLSPVIAANWQ